MSEQKILEMPLVDLDPGVAEAIELERKRQQNTLEMIASENFVPRAVLESQGSVLTNKYAEGLPGKRYYGGCEFVDIVESLAISRVKELFGAEHANVQPHSGAQANNAVMHALLNPGDTIMGYSRTGHGLVIHRADCPHCRRSMKTEPSRWLEVQWAEEQNHANHAVPVDILVSDQNTALASITTSIAEANSSIVGVVFYEKGSDQYLRLTLQVRDRGHLMYVIKMIKKNPGVLQAKRVLEAGAPHK